MMVRLNANSKRFILLLPIIFLFGCTPNMSQKNNEPRLPFEDPTMVCENEALKYRLVNLDYHTTKGYIDFTTTMTNLCNKKYYLYVNTSTTHIRNILLRNDKLKTFTKNLNVIDFGYCAPYFPMPCEKIEFSRKYLLLKPGKEQSDGSGFYVYVKEDDKELWENYLFKKSFYVLTEVIFATSYIKSNYDEKILITDLIDFDREEALWYGKKGTLSKCTFANEKDGIRHYTCEFVKNVLTEEDKWAK